MIATFENEASVRARLRPADRLKLRLGRKRLHEADEDVCLEYNMWGRSGGRGGMSQNVIQTAGDGAAVDGSVALGQISVSARITVTFELE